MARFSYTEASAGGAVEGPFEIKDAGIMMQPLKNKDGNPFPVLILVCETAHGERKLRYNVPFSKERWAGKVLWSMDGDTPLDVDSEEVELAPHIYVEADDAEPGQVILRPNVDSEFFMLMDSIVNVGGFPEDRLNEEGFWALRGAKGVFGVHEDEKGYGDKKHRAFSIVVSMDAASIDAGKSAKKGAAAAKGGAKTTAAKPAAAPKAAKVDIDEEHIELAKAFALEYVTEQEAAGKTPVSVVQTSVQVFAKSRANGVQDPNMRTAMKEWVIANPDDIDGLAHSDGKLGLA